MAQTSDESAKKRRRILEAALEVCRKRGVDGARMEEVAALARVSKGTLYRFFARKGDLLLATILHSYEQSLPLFEEGSQAGGDPGRRLARVLDSMLAVLAVVSPRMTIHYQAWGLVAEDPELQARLYAFLNEFHRERGEALENILREGVATGRFRRDTDVVAFADALQALLSGFLYRATFDPERATTAGLRRSFEALTSETLANPDAPRRGTRNGNG